MNTEAPGSRRIHLYLGSEAKWLQQAVTLTKAFPTLRIVGGNVFTEEMAE